MLVAPLYATQGSIQKQKPLKTNNIQGPTESKWNNYWTFIKGNRAQNALFFEMFTFHMNPSSLKTRNWHQQMIAIQYKGIFAGTFVNSFYNRTYTLGISRSVYRKDSSSHNWNLNIGYRLGALYGYKAGEAPLSSALPVIPFIQGFAAISYLNTFGVEFNIVADPSIALFMYF